jgi:hypothetical protein
MDVYTKVFLVNWAVLVSVVLINKHLLNDALKDGWASLVMGVWSLSAFLSAPVLIIYLIVRYL